MTSDFQYTREITPIIEAYDKIFDELCFVWENDDVYLASEHHPTCEAFNNINWKRVQSSILPQHLRCFVPYEKSKRLKEKDYKAFVEEMKLKGIKIY